jgi:hypothetical protein
MRLRGRYDTCTQWRVAVVRKPRMLSTIQTVLAHHFGKADSEVMRAFTELSAVGSRSTAREASCWIAVRP